MTRESNFENYMRKQGLSENTMEGYLWTVRQFKHNFGKITEHNVQAYKSFLIEHYKPQTVNTRIQGLNKYLKFKNIKDYHIKTVKLQNRTYLENVISDADYKYLKRKLKKDGVMSWYFVVWFLAATGARVSELVRFKAEHVHIGYLDIYGKGGKMRRIYIPKRLRTEALSWLESEHRDSGYLFLNNKGNQISTNGIGQQLKIFAKRYGINRDVVYPHSFRHLFAKNFISKYNDIALLSDLLGHSSIETTRIYLRKTASEQREIIDKVVTW